MAGKRLAIYLSDRQHAVLAETAAALGRRPSWVVQMLVMRYAAKLVADYHAAQGKPTT